jgi:tetratricopeptide (TPR) repeat protein
LLARPILAVVLCAYLLWALGQRPQAPSDGPLQIGAAGADSLPGAAPAQDPAAPPRHPLLSADALFEKASPAVLRVEVLDQDFSLIGQGSGFLVSEDGLIATNYHVVRGGFHARVLLGDDRAFAVEGVAAMDPRSDLALLKIEGRQFPYLELAGDQLPALGSKVFAIGSPKGLIHTLSEGLVSGHRPNGEDGPTMILSTAPISHGSSGGPLVGSDGKVVGVTTTITPEGQNFNLAAPVERVARLLGARGPLQTVANAGRQPLRADAAPKPTDSRLKEVWTAINAGELTGALRLLGACETEEKGSPDYWFAVGFVHAKLGHYELAVDAWRATIRLDPARAYSFFNLGLSLGSLNRFQEAKEAFRSAIGLKPDFSDAYFYLGYACMCLGQYSAAIDPFRTVVRLEPQRVDAHGMLGQAYLYAGRYDEAADCFRTTVSLASNHPDHYYWLGVALQRARSYQEAIKAFNAVLRLNSNHAAAHLHLGEIHFDLAVGYRRANKRTLVVAERSRAVGYLRRAVQLDPKGKVGRDAARLLSSVAHL